MSYHYGRTLDADRRLRLPNHWAPNVTQQWLIFPRYFLFRAEPQSLQLVQTTEHALRFIVSESPDHKDEAPTVELAQKTLRELSGQHGHPPNLVTTVQIAPAPTRFALTQAQIDWLGCHGRKVVLSGFLHAAYIYSPRRWKEWNREMRRNPIKLEGLFPDEKAPICGAAPSTIH